VKYLCIANCFLVIAVLISFIILNRYKKVIKYIEDTQLYKEKINLARDSEWEKAQDLERNEKIRIEIEKTDMQIQNYKNLTDNDTNG
jgi:hypothetical protein